MEKENRYIKETTLLDFSSPLVLNLVLERGWNNLESVEKVKSIYNYVRDEILFGYNSSDRISASSVLKSGYGQCNTKAILFMAILRCVGIECRIHGFEIDRRIQKGAMSGFIYRLSPGGIIHSWVEVHLCGVWYNLEGIILDKRYLEKIQRKFSKHSGTFIGYGVACKDLGNPMIDFSLNNTYIQRLAIIKDYGTFDSPDELFEMHNQELSFFKKFLYSHFARHVMNRNVRRIRDSI